MIFATTAFADTLAFPDTMGFHPVMVKGGHEKWLELTRFDDVAEKAKGNVIIVNCAGGFGIAGTRRNVIGYMDDGAPVETELCHFREIEKHPEVAHVVKNFVPSMAPRGTYWRSHGGTVMAHYGAPSVDEGEIAYDSARELRQCGITPLWDAAGAVVKGGHMDKARQGFITTGAEPEPVGRHAPWFTANGTAYTHTFTDTERFKNGNSPRQSRSGVVNIALVVGIDDPKERCGAAMEQLAWGYSAALNFRPNTDADWGQAENLSVKQVRALQAASKEMGLG